MKEALKWRRNLSWKEKVKVNEVWRIYRDVLGQICRKLPRALSLDAFWILAADLPKHQPREFRRVQTTSLKDCCELLLHVPTPAFACGAA